MKEYNVHQTILQCFHHYVYIGHISNVNIGHKSNVNIGWKSNVYIGIFASCFSNADVELGSIATDVFYLLEDNCNVSIRSICVHWHFPEKQCFKKQIPAKFTLLLKAMVPLLVIPMCTLG